MGVGKGSAGCLLPSLFVRNLATDQRAADGKDTRGLDESCRMDCNTFVAWSSVTE